MRSVLTVTADKNLMNKIKLMHTDESVEFYYAYSGEDASNIALKNEISVACIDYNMPVISGEELCELILSQNPDTQLMVLFKQSKTKEVLAAYNKYHINKLICMEHMVLEDIPILIESCLHIYNREEELNKLDDEVKSLNDMYLKPMQEMSSILNERLIGYENIIRVLRKSINYVLEASDSALKSVDIFVDRILNDYIHIFMIKEPDLSVYFNRIRDSFNKPSEKKYFMFSSDSDIPEDDNRFGLLFCLDALTICFDVFYPHYRGKISIEKKKDSFEINSIYEVRRDKSIEDVYPYVMKTLLNILKCHSVGVKSGAKDNIIQYRITI